MSELAAFDCSWRAKLARELDRVAGNEARREIMAGGTALEAEATPESIYAWTRNMLARMEERLPQAGRQDVLNACGCWMGKGDLKELRELYATTGDLDRVLEKAGEGLLAYLRGCGVSENTVDEVRRRGWGWPGRRVGIAIGVAKIPFEGTIDAFFAESDPAKRRAMNYCHCPRVRDVLKTGRGLSRTYCHCSAGFYKKNLEEILGRPVAVEIVETVLSGDEVCSFAIQLPADL